jgi:hypothetical protein
MRNRLLRDIPIYLIIVVSLSVIVYGLVRFGQGNPPTAPENIVIVLGLTLAVLAALAWYMVEATRRSERGVRKIRDEMGTVEILRRADSLFDLSRVTLKQNESWTRVRVYSPTGLWVKSPKKMEWLKGLRFALHSEKVGELLGVFGLPEDEETFDQNSKEQIRLFDNTPNTRLRYLPPPDKDHPTTIPAFGLIVFERESPGKGIDPHFEVLFTFDGDTSDATVGNGFAVRSMDPGMVVARWFDEHVFKDLSSGYVLRDTCARFHVPMEDGLEQVHKTYRRHDAADIVVRMCDALERGNLGAVSDFLSPRDAVAPEQDKSPQRRLPWRR